MKKRVALIAGGDSGEYEVSINSAKAVQDQLSKEKYEVFFIHIKGTDWHYINAQGKRVAVDKNDFSITLQGTKVTFDVAFILIHGTPGEDGKLQGYFDLLKIPYTTSDVFTSALTFKKNFTKHVASALNVAVSKTLFLRRGEKYSVGAMLREVGLPCFVKPNKGGSSVGITKVKRKEELDEAISAAFREDDEVLVEEFLQGDEIGCGVYLYDDVVIPLPLTEIVSKTEFFDYQAKYLGASDEITPARIPQKKAEECQLLSAQLYRQFNCRGLVRFDYILREGTFYFLEVNTIPGLSKASIVPQQIRYMGKKEADVYSELIEEALNSSR
jgi:D-alanine-D-alanine ligase